MSPTVVPTTMKSISSGVTWARSIACRAARIARSEGPSCSSTTRRSRIPARWTAGPAGGGRGPLVPARAPPLADPGALDDPLVGGLDHLLELLVGQDPL